MRVLAIAVVIGCLAGTALGQGPRYSLNLNGTAGFGIDYNTNDTRQLDSPSQNSLNWYRDFSLAGTGFVYDDRLLNYDVKVSQGGTDTSSVFTTSQNRYLQGAGNFNFLSERDFPFSIFFSRTTDDSRASLFPTVTTLTSLFGVRGNYHRKGVPAIYYNVSRTTTSYDSALLTFPGTQNTAGDLATFYNLRGWQLRGNVDYLRQSLGAQSDAGSTSAPNFLASSKSFQVDATRELRKDMHLTLDALRSTFDVSSGDQGSSGTTGLIADLDWKPASKWQTSFSTSFADSSTNVLRLLQQVDGQAAPGPVFNPVTLSTTTESATGRVAYLVNTSLTLHADTSYGHTGFSDSTLADMTGQTRDLVSDASVNAGGGYNFRHTLWKFHLDNNGSVQLQRYSFLNGQSNTGTGYSVSQGVSTGNVRTLLVSGTVGYDHHTNPYFLNVTTSDNLTSSARIETNHFNFVHFSASGQISRQEVSLADSNDHVLGKGASFSMVFPRQKVSLYGMFFNTNANSVLFGSTSILTQTPGSIQSVPTTDLLLPTFLTQTSGKRFGLLWSPSTNLAVQAQYVHNRFYYWFQDQTLDFDSEWDATVQYKFGRFTFYGGYSRGGNITGVGLLPQIESDRNRIFFQVRFPFHVTRIH